MKKGAFSFLKKFFSWFLRTSLKKKIIVLSILILIIGIAAFFVFKNKAGGYVVEKVKKSDVSQVVSETGNVGTGATTSVTSPSTGIVEEIYVKNGNTVAVGDELFKVKSTATEQEKKAAYSAYLTAVSTLNTANSTALTLRSTMLDAWKDFYDLATNSTYEEDDGTPKTENRKLVEFNTAQDDWLASEKKYKDQQNVIAQTQADVSSKRLLYEATQNTLVKATADGVVQNLSIAKGESIKATDEALKIVSESTNLFVTVSINEIDVPKIKPGQKAIIEIDAIDNKKFDGEVTRVDAIGTDTLSVITYNVYVALSEIDPNIRSGMTANVDIQTTTLKNVLSVPNSAVKLYKGEHAVQVLDGKEPKYIPVKIGIKGDLRTEIKEGVTEGEEIIVGAKNKLIERSSPFGF